MELEMVPAGGVGGAVFRSALGESERVVSSDRTVRASASPLTIVPAMASIGSSRLCTHAEKLCQYGHFTQLRRKVSTTTCAKSRPAASRTSGALFQHCQDKTNTRDNRIGLARATSTMQTQMPGSLPDYQIDPYRLAEDDLKDMFGDIRMELINNTTQKELQPISTYYLDGQGKAIRPILTILMARAINYHKGRNILSHSQRQIAMISEMIHTSSLLHDDVIDQSDIRRGKPSVNVVWSQKKRRKEANAIHGWAPIARVLSRFGSGFLAFTCCVNNRKTRKKRKENIDQGSSVVQNTTKQCKNSLESDESIDLLKLHILEIDSWNDATHDT